MTFAAVLCCVMTATVFTACGDDDTSYPATYKYDVVVAEAFFNSEQYSEVKTVEAAFKHAIGADASYYEMLKNPKDAEMKAECEAVRKQYETYYYTSNKDEAFAALAAMKDSLGNEVYKERYQTLAKLIGSKSLKSPFETALGGYITRHLPDTQANTMAITHICDSIAQAHESDVLAVDATVLVGKVGLFDAPSNAVLVWGKTFHAK